MTGSPSVTDYWDVDGEPLHQYAWNITTLGDTRLSPPPLRGTNLQVPRARGKRWMPKQVDGNTITLAMYVLGSNADGTIPTDVDTKAKFQDNWRALRSMLFTPERQFTLTKHFRVAGTPKVASALAQYNSGLAPTMTGADRAEFTVDLDLADPYFYSDPVTVNLSTGTQTVTVEGDDITEAILIHVVGSRANFKIRNDTLGMEVQYASGLASGDTLDIDVPNFTAVTDPASSASFDSTGAIVHAGHDMWLRLGPGDNTIIVSSTSGSGPVTMTYQPVWW